MRQRNLIPGILFAILFSAVPLAAQDEAVISIRSGSFVVDADVARHPFELVGTKGFRASGSVFIDGGHFTAWTTCNQVPECVPGATVPIDASWGGLDLPATIKYRGKTFGTIGDDSGMVIGFSGNLTLPAMSTEPTTVTVPFEFAGRFFHVDVGGGLLTGGGTAAFELVWGVEDSWVIERVTFEFQQL
jgi:hypothetical protein